MNNREQLESTLISKIMTSDSKEKMAMIITESKALLNKQDKHGDTLLFEMSKLISERREWMLSVIQKASSVAHDKPNIVNSNEVMESSIATSILERYNIAVDVLIKNGADVMIRNNDGDTFSDYFSMFVDLFPMIGTNCHSETLRKIFSKEIGVHKNKIYPAVQSLRGREMGLTLKKTYTACNIPVDKNFQFQTFINDLKLEVGFNRKDELFLLSLIKAYKHQKINVNVVKLIADLLLSLNLVDINTIDIECDNALDMAIKAQSMDLVKTLVTYGAKFNPEKVVSTLDDMLGQSRSESTQKFACDLLLYTQITQQIKQTELESIGEDTNDITKKALGKSVKIYSRVEILFVFIFCNVTLLILGFVVNMRDRNQPNPELESAEIEQMSLSEQHRR